MKSFTLLIGTSLTLMALAAVQNFGSAHSDLDQWFLQATSFNKPGTAKHISKPDFLGSTDWRTCARDRFSEDGASFYGVWSLLEYDRKHHIAFARGMTDQCSLAVFQAPPPSQKVAAADLSHFGTVRGLRIGSPYSQVLALYGPPVKSGKRFITSYAASIPAIAVGGEHVDLDQRITLVIQDGLVSSIAVYIAESGLVLNHQPAHQEANKARELGHVRFDKTLKVSANKPCKKWKEWGISSVGRARALQA